MDIRKGCRLVLVCVAAGAGWAQAETLDIVDTLPGSWVDISTIGVALDIQADDVAAIDSNVGNAVFPIGRWWVGNNGAVGFGLNSLLPPITEPIPSSQIFGGDQAVAVFGTDIGNDDGNVFWAVLPAARTGRGSVLIVQWHNHRFEGSTDTGRFQLQVFSDPGPHHVYAQFVYDDIEQPFPDGGAIATIGYQDGGAGFNDVQWSYQLAGAVANGTVLSLVPEPGTAALLLLAGLVIRWRWR